MRALAEGFVVHVEANAPWMAGNLVLAFIPWLLAIVLFRPRARVGIVWLTALAACIALLPNAAYVLTDAVHLPGMVRDEPSDATVIAVIFPMFGALFLLGMLAYIDAVRRMSRWIVSRGWLSRRWPLEVSVHLASSVAIYVGRIKRLNSWDLVIRPRLVLSEVHDGFTRPTPIAGMIVMFCVLTVGYVVVRPVLDVVSRRVHLQRH